MVPNLRKVVVARGGESPPPAPLSSLTHPPQSPIAVTNETSSDASLPDPLEAESLMLNIDASLRVHARHQLYSWTQGLLQNMIRHELLICALRSGEPLLFQVDSFAAPPVEPAPFSEVFRRDTSLVPHIIKTWEDNDFHPVLMDAGSASRFAQDPLSRELIRIGTSGILAHGTYDVFGKVASFFLFASRPGMVGGRQAYLAELLAPFLHLAWVRTQLSRQASEGGVATPGAPALLTS